jgi:SNF2 family DNA or RNA helicase
MKSLLDNQQKAIEKLSIYKVGALFMEAGTGKTLAAYNLVQSVTDIDYILWLTPFQTKINLQNEIDKYGDFNCKFDIVGIETLSNSDKTYLELIKNIQYHNTFIICDESLKIKNWEAKRTQRIIELSKLAQYKLILNGTPLSKNLLDLWSQMEFLSPKILKMKIAQFKNTFCEYTRIIKSKGRYTIVKEFINKYHNLDYLYSLIEPYVYECNLNLEIGKQFIDWNYNLDSISLEKYNIIKNKYLDDKMMELKNNNIFLEMTQKMQHEYCCTPEKFELLNQFYQNNNPDKAIIACKFIDSTQEVRNQFPKANIFTYGKHSFGLNLQNYDTIIFFDKTWDYAQREQFEHRISRIGQQSDTCRYINLTGNVGLETLINQNIDKKQSMLNYFKNKSIQEIKEVL